MSNELDIALVGFSSFERSTIESFFRLAARRKQGYRLTEDVAGSAMVVANADDPATIDRLLSKPPAQPVLLVGASDAGTGWPLEPRPIKLMNILNAVDAALAPAQPRPAAQFRDVTPSRPVPLDTPEYRPGDTQAFVRATSAPTPDDFILLADDQDAVHQFMQERLLRLGFATERVRTGEQALGRLDSKPYKFVFLDTNLDGMDAFQACKAVKQHKYAQGKAPVVVILADKVGAMDRMKGTLAGCDAWLVKPLDERELLKVIAKHDTQVQRGFQATALGKGPPTL